MCLLAPEFAASHLQALLDSEHSVIAVYTQPDRPAGRGQKLTPSPVKQLASKHNIPVLQPLNLRSTEAQQELAAFNADLMVVVAYFCFFLFFRCGIACSFRRNSSKNIRPHYRYLFW